MNKTLRTLALALGAAAVAGWSGSAHAAFVFYNDDGGNGSISGSYPAFTITGSDDGSGNYDGAFYVQTYAVAATVTFTWQYESFDTSGTVYDPAGWILNGVETQLSVNGDPGTTSSGTFSWNVKAGDTFGWYVVSEDSIGGAGVLAVNQDLPPPPPPIPEPQEAMLMLAGLAALFAAARRPRHG
jgi:MYXO-CTERM domain-containing protein